MGYKLGTLAVALAGCGASVGAGGVPGGPDGGAGDGADPTEGGPSSALCGPTAGGPFWIQETDTVTTTIKCATGLASTGTDFTLDPLPPGAVYDPGTTSLTWKPGLDQAAVYLITVTDRTHGESGELKIGVADKLDDPKNVPIKDPGTYTEEMGLPVFHLQTTPALQANLKRLQDAVDFKRDYPCGPDATTPATAENGFCADFDTPVRITYRGHTYEAEGRYRGWSSLYYAPNKLNYVLKFPSGDRFTEPVLSDGKMAGRHKIDLITSIDDNSYVRWRLVFELAKRLHPDGGIHVQNYTAMVYVWDQAGKPDYRGLYTVADRVDEDFFRGAGLANGGDVYMAIDHVGSLDVLAPDMRVNPPGARTRKCFFEGFEKRSGAIDQCNGLMFVPQAFDGLKPLLDFVSTSKDAIFRSDFAKWVDLDDMMTWFIYATAAETGDSYAKNAIYHHDPVGGGPWRVVVWDFNDSFGQDAATHRDTRPARPDAKNFWVDPKTIVSVGSTPGVGQAAYNNILRRLWNDPEYGPRLRQRYAAAIRNEVSAEKVLAMLDDLLGQIRDGARREDAYFGALYRDFWTKDYWGTKRPASGTSVDVIRSHAQEIDFLKQWITDRWAYLQTVFAP